MEMVRPQSASVLFWSVSLRETGQFPFLTALPILNVRRASYCVGSINALSTNPQHARNSGWTSRSTPS